MTRPRAENRLSEAERTALSQAIRSVVLHEGNYRSVVRGAGVSQPQVSLALHRRLIARTATVERLFEYLQVRVPTGKEPPSDAKTTDNEIYARNERLVGLLGSLSDGSQEADDRLAVVLAALQGFSR